MNMDGEREVEREVDGNVEWGEKRKIKHRRK